MSLATAEYDIHRALRSVLLASGAVPASQMAFAAGFQRPIGKPWVRETFRLGTGESATGGEPRITRFASAYLLDVFLPAGWAEDRVYGVTGKLLDAFRIGAVCAYNGVAVHLDGATVGRAGTETDWLQYAVTVSWWADVAH